MFELSLKNSSTSPIRLPIHMFSSLRRKEGILLRGSPLLVNLVRLIRFARGRSSIGPQKFDLEVCWESERIHPDFGWSPSQIPTVSELFRARSDLCLPNRPLASISRVLVRLHLRRTRCRHDTDTTQSVAASHRSSTVRRLLPPATLLLFIRRLGVLRSTSSL